MGLLNTLKQHQRLALIIVSIPGGLKRVLEDPKSVIDHRPAQCLACGHVGPWHVHGTRTRWVQIGADNVRLTVTRFRCARCRATATALPDDLLPGLRHDLETIGKIVATYLDGEVSYRALPLIALGIAPPAGNTANTIWTSAAAPSPTPATCFRWLSRFASSALPWWRVAAQALQGCAAYVPSPAPEQPAARAWTSGKQATLRLAWQARDAFRRLATAQGAGPTRWIFSLLHAPFPPPGLDRTGLFIRPPP